MGKIYKNQSQLRFTAEAGDSIVDTTSTKIKYLTSGDTAGEWSATILGDSVDGVIYYDVGDSDDLYRSGIWKFWSYITFSDGRSLPGEAFEIEIYEEGN